MPSKPKTIDDYLKDVDADKRPALEKLRAAIRKIVPEAEECINYGVAAFRIDGKSIAGFGASAKHCSYYPMSGSVVEKHADDLKAFETSKGAVNFQPNKPISAALVKKLIQTRIAEIPGSSSKKTVAKPTSKKSKTSTVTADEVIALLKKKGTKAARDAMARYAIPSDKAVGVSVGELKKLSKELGRSHELAAELWKTGVYEARMLAGFLDEPALVTPEQMEAWCKEFDNWAICDHSCFHLFDKTPHAWKKVRAWAGRKNEFEKRAAFALIASLSLHDKKCGDEPFVEALVLIERAADDDRNFVKKAVNWALRSVGKRSPALHSASIAVAERLANKEDRASRWIGKDALRELKSASVTRRVFR